MGDVISITANAAVAVVGGVLAIRGKSRSWRLSGLAWALTGLGICSYLLVWSMSEQPYESWALDLVIPGAIVSFFAPSGTCERPGRPRTGCVVAGPAIVIRAWWASSAAVASPHTT